MKYVHISTKVDRRIEDLKNACKAGTGVARKATFIIESLTSNTIRNPPDAVGNFTKYGEKRIRNCRKYDLGCGYRLITLQRGLKVFVSLLGTHDEEDDKDEELLKISDQDLRRVFCGLVEAARSGAAMKDAIKENTHGRYQKNTSD